MKKLTTISITLAIAMLVSFSSVMATDNPTEKPEIMTTSLTGKILDDVTGEALVGVAVKIEGTDQEVYTDFDGIFTFETILPGEYDISATFISYRKKSSRLAVKLGQDNMVKMKLITVANK